MSDNNLNINNNTITSIITKPILEPSLKTDEYTLNAIKRYRLKNLDKIKEYNKEYNKQKKEAKIAENPNIKLNKKQLIEKINILESKIKEYELKLNIFI